jgi:hypothetical protein
MKLTREQLEEFYKTQEMISEVDPDSRRFSYRLLTAGDWFNVYGPDFLQVHKRYADLMIRMSNFRKAL